MRPLLRDGPRPPLGSDSWPTTRSFTPGLRAASAVDAIAAAYGRGETDEFVQPTVIGDYDGIADGDASSSTSGPTGRASSCGRWASPDFDEFDRGGRRPARPDDADRVPGGWPYPVAFPPEAPGDDPLAEVIASAAARQLHVAETEKYAHVTYFFNGGREAEWEGEERCLVDSAARRPHLRPQARDERRRGADGLRERWGEGGYRFGIINFANPDMVGHTGVIPRAVGAVEAVDRCLARVVAAVHESGGACIVTADHGNADTCWSPTARRTPRTRPTRCR